MADDLRSDDPVQAGLRLFESIGVDGARSMLMRYSPLSIRNGEWWTDKNNNGNRDAATMSELQYFCDNYIANGWIVADGGAGTLETSYANGVMTMRVARGSVSEPSIVLMLCAGLMALGIVKRIRM